MARTYWRWHLTWNPLEWYQPASSAVGMYQITDGTFQEATRYCIHDHQVVEDGPWHDPQFLLVQQPLQPRRAEPCHRVDCGAARSTRRTVPIGTRQIGPVTLQQKQDLAAVIHLCGAGAGHAYAARGFRLTSPPTMRRPRRASLSLTSQCNEAAVRPTGVRRQTTSARQPSVTTIALTTRVRRISSSHRPPGLVSHCARARAFRLFPFLPKGSSQTVLPCAH